MVSVHRINSSRYLEINSAFPGIPTEFKTSNSGWSQYTGAVKVPASTLNVSIRSRQVD